MRFFQGVHMIRPKVACGSVKIGSYAAGGQIPYDEEQFYCCRACETALIGNQDSTLLYGVEQKPCRVPGAA
jgi:hypothetical protein